MRQVLLVGRVIHAEVRFEGVLLMLGVLATDNHSLSFVILSPFDFMQMFSVTGSIHCDMFVEVARCKQRKKRSLLVNIRCCSMMTCEVRIWFQLCLGNERLSQAWNRPLYGPHQSA